MCRFALRMGLIVFAVVALGQNAAFASFCGAARHCSCNCNCAPCCPQCCIVMRQCQETVYEYQEMTAYKVVYEDVKDKVKVPCVKYEPAPRIACVPDTVLVPPPPPACPPTNPCGPCATLELVPMNICRKVTLDGFRPVDKEEPGECTRVVARQVPYKVTLCIPHIETKLVPVKVCCPMPCCCATPVLTPTPELESPGGT